MSQNDPGAAAPASPSEELFKKYVAESRIIIDSDRYIVAVSTLDKEEAVAIAERLELVHHFDRIKQICFINGMVDGITMYLKQIRALNKPLGMEKPIQIGGTLLDYIASQRTKIDNPPPDEAEKTG